MATNTPENMTLVRPRGRRVIGTTRYPNGDVADYIKVPWDSRERWEAWCRDCKQIVEFNQVEGHKQTTGHKRLDCIAVPEPHRHTNWCSPICGPLTVVDRKPRKVALPVQEPVYTGPTMCFFGMAHVGGTQTERCPNCGAMVSPSQEDRMIDKDG